MTSLPDIVTPQILEQTGVKPPAIPQITGTKSAANLLYAMDNLPRTTVGLELGPKLGPEGKVETSRKIPSGVHGKVVQALTGQLQNLLSMQQQDRAFFDTVFLNDPAHQNEANLLKLVTNKEGAIDRQKISELLELRADDNTYPGLQMALTAVDTFSSRLGMAMGAAAVARHESALWRDHTPSAEVKLVAQKRSDDRLNLDMGGTRKAFEKPRNKTIAAIGTIASAGIGYLTNTVGALVGGAIAAPAVGFGVYKAYERSGKGWHIDQEAFRLGLEEMQKPENAVERQIMIRAYGVDPTDFTTNANGEIIQNPGKQSSAYRTGNIQELQDAYLALATTRIEVMTALGNPLKGTFASPEENFLLFQDDPEKAMLYREKNNVAYARQIDERWQRLIRLERDAGRNPTTTDELLSLKLEARRQVFGEYLNQVEEILDKPKEEQRRGENVRVLGGLKEKYQYKKGELNNPEVRGERVKERTKSKSESRKMHEDAKVNLEVVQTGCNDFISSRLKISGLYREIQSKLHNPALTSLQEIDRVLKARTGTTIDNLKTLRDELAEAEKELGEKTNNGRDIDAFMARGNNAYSQLISKGKIGYGFEPAFLTSASIDELQRRMNTLHAQDIVSHRPTPRGWPVESNNNEANRMIILRAKSEAIVRRDNQDLFTPSELDRITSHIAIDENSIRAITPEQLIQAVGRRTYSTPPNQELTLQEATEVIHQAQQRLFSRANTFIKVVATEKNWRTEHNNSLVARTTAIDSDLTLFQTTLTNIEEQHQQILALQQPENLAETIIQKHYSSQYTKNGVDLIASLQADTAGKTYDLSFGAVQNLSFSDFISRINEARLDGVAGAWEAALNNNHDNIFAAICYMAEARAQASPSLAQQDQNLQNVLAAGGLTEEQIAGKTPPVVLQMIRQRSQNWNTGNTNEIQRAISAATIRAKVRQRYLAEVLSESQAQAQGVLASIRQGQQPPNVNAQYAINAPRIFASKDPELDTELRLKVKKMSDLASDRNVLTRLGVAQIPNINMIEQRLRDLQAERAGLVQYDAKIDAETTSISTLIADYTNVLTAYQKKRNEIQSKLKDDPLDGGISSTSLQWRIDQYEENPIDQLRVLRNQLGSEEAKLRSGSEDQKKIASIFETGKQTALLLTGRVNDTLLQINGNPGLSPQEIVTLSIDDLNSRINTAHQRDSSIGWPEKENAAHVHELYLAKIEARNRLYDQDFTAGGNWLFDDIESHGEVWQMTEVDLLTVSQDELLDRIHEAARRGVPGAWAAGDQNEAKWSADLRDARQEAQRRFERRIRSPELQEVIGEANRTIDTIKLSEEGIIEGMKDDIEYIELVHTMASRQGEIYSWIKEWAGTGGKARDATSFQPIDVGDVRIPLYIRQDRSQNPPVDRLIPQGLVDVYQALFNFEGAADVASQEKMFQKIISHPRFNPDVIGAVLNQELDLRLGTIPGATLDLNCANVFYAIQERLHNNDLPGLNYQDQPPVNRRTLHRAIRQIIQDDIARAKVM